MNGSTVTVGPGCLLTSVMKVGATLTGASLTFWITMDVSNPPQVFPSGRYHMVAGSCTPCVPAAFCTQLRGSDQTIDRWAMIGMSDVTTAAPSQGPGWTSFTLTVEQAQGSRVTW